MIFGGLLPRSCFSRLPGFSEKYASAGDIAGMGMRMLMELEVSEKKDNTWCSTGVKMLNEFPAAVPAAGFTEHPGGIGGEQSRS